MANETFCDREDIDTVITPTSEGLKLAAGVLTLATLPVSLFCFYYFFSHKRQYVVLEKRNTFLLTCLFLGLLLQHLTITTRVFVGVEQFSCRVFSILINAQLILLVGVAITRLLSLLWRISYNQRLIDGSYKALLEGNLDLRPTRVSLNNNPVPKSENSGYYTKEVFEQVKADNKDCCLAVQNSNFLQFVKLSPCLFRSFCWNPKGDLPRELEVAQFLASKYFINCCLVLFIVANSIIIALQNLEEFPEGEDCSGCPIEALFEFSDVVILVLSALFYFFTLYRLWKYPDALGIRKELLVLGLCYLALALITFALHRLLEDLEREGRFEFSLLIAAGTPLALIYSFPYQVSLARRTVANRVDMSSTLEEVLADREGKKALSLFLALNLSLETLFFYEAAQQWRMRSMTEEERINSARHIYDQYIRSDAFMMINISWNCRHDIEQRLDEAPETLFEDASKQMLSLLSNDIFPRFLESSYYKAYSNENQPGV